jgi:outer membrane protein
MAFSRSRSLALVLLSTAIAAPATSRADPLLTPLLWRALAPGGAAGKAAPTPTPPTSGHPSDPYSKAVEVKDLGDLAGEPAKIDLPQLLQTAVRQAPSLASATIDVEIATAQVESSMGLDDWTVAARVDGSTSRRSTFGLVSKNFGVTSQASIGRQLSTGGTITLQAENDYTRGPNFSAPNFDPDSSFTDSVTLQLQQPLLRGRGRAVARALQLENALIADAARLTLRQDAINVVQNVVTSYWDLVQAQRNLEIARSSLQLAQERLRVTQIGVNGGKIADSELLAVEEAIATRQEDVLNSEVAVLQQSLVVRRTVGMEIGPGQISLDGGAELSVPSRTWDLQDVLGQSMRSSPQLVALSKQEANATIVVDATENGLLPQLDLTVYGGPQGISAGVVDRDVTPILHTSGTQTDAFDDLVHFNGIVAGATLTFQQSLGRHQARGQVRAQRAQREKIRVNAVDVKLQIAQAVAQAVALVRTADQRVQLGHRAVELAQKNILVEQSRFELGKSTNFDVLLRQDELRQAQLREARAQVDWHKAQAIIAGLTGTILVDYGIDLK